MKMRLTNLCDEQFDPIRRPMTPDQARTHTDATLFPPQSPDCYVLTDGGYRVTFRGYGGATYHAYYASTFGL